MTFRFLSGRSAVVTASAALIVGGAAAVAVPEAFATQTAPKTCYDGSGSVSADARLTAPISTSENVTMYESTDGTCTTPAGYFLTAVKANNRTAALTLCDSLGFFNVDRMSLTYAKVPSNWYECNNRGG